MARAGLCFVWAGFWAARVLLADALALLNPLQVKPALLELLGENAVDQGFSICMVWLTAEVAVIVRDAIGKGIQMLIAKTPISWTDRILRGFPLERLKAEVERREKSEPNNGSSPQTTASRADLGRYGIVSLRLRAKPADFLAYLVGKPKMGRRPAQVPLRGGG